MRRTIFMVSLSLLLTSLGCGPKSSLTEPKFKPGKAADMAMELFDKDGDAILSPEELKASPGLQAGLKTIDKDSDGQISREELFNRIEEFQKSKSAGRVVRCMFKKGSGYVKNAKITFTPEPFLSDVISTATGETDLGGMTDVRSPGMPGVQQGFYRIEIEGLDSPKTQLGVEVSGQSGGDQRGLYLFEL